MIIDHNKYMQQAIDLAIRGRGQTHTNPLVGAVIVNSNGDVIGSGFHEHYGQAHAEVNAVASVEDKSLLDSATMYVTLEPCSHHGKTPPCTDLIIAHRFARVVIGSSDPNPKVSRGGGMELMRQAGIEVVEGVMQQECSQINVPFFVFHEQKRPYIMLKWAESSDGYLDIVRPQGSRPAWMTSPEAKVLVHRWRAENQAIMVGRRTIEMDDPQLTVREYDGENPLRVVLDRRLQLNPQHAIFDAQAETLIFTQSYSKASHAATHMLNYDEPVLPQVMSELHRRGIMRLMVEGGGELLASLIESGLWDEARIFTAPHQIMDYYPGVRRAHGVKAPSIDGLEDSVDLTLGLRILKNNQK